MSTISLAEIRKHCKATDAWIVLHNKVYDVTKYLEDHPGGVEIMLGCAGRIATLEFEDTGHSTEAKDLLETFYIGELPDEERAKTVDVYIPKFQKVSQISSGLPVSNDRFPLSTILKLGLSGGLAATAWLLWKRDFNAIRSFLEINQKSALMAGSKFWYGVAAATFVEVGVVAGAVAWIWSKVDTETGYSIHPATRAARKDQVICLPRNSSSKENLPTAPGSEVLHLVQWRNFRLVRKTQVAHDVYRFIFALPSRDGSLGLPTGQHISLRAEINGQSVSRSYTPVSNDRDLGRFELIIKVYDKGIMSTHLQNLPIGQPIEARGPKGNMRYARKYAEHIGMIAGGTGITPMFQIIRTICEDDLDDTKVTLLYANVLESGIMLRDELDSFAQQYPEKFKVRYVLEKPPPAWSGYSGYINSGLIQKYLPAPKNGKILLCGPPPMVNAMKSCFQELNFEDSRLVSKMKDEVYIF